MKKPKTTLITHLKTGGLRPAVKLMKVGDLKVDIKLPLLQRIMLPEDK